MKEQRRRAAIPVRICEDCLDYFTTRLLTTGSANLENELNEKLNAPSVENQKTNFGKEIEKTINDRMIVMREVVVRAFIFPNLWRLLNPFLRRKSHDASRSSNKR